MTLIRRYGWWILINNVFWVCFWLYDFVAFTSARNLVEVIVPIGGLIAELRGWRIAPLLNVGYYGVNGLWLVSYLVLDMFHPVPEPGGTALVVVLIGFPMLLVAIVNWRIYRSRKLDIAVT